jgi:hypothetical protein
MNQPLTQEEWLTYLDTTWKECLNKAWDKELDSMNDDIIAMARKAGPLISTPFDVWCERFAALAQAAERNKLAAWMMAQGYATGHGDTIEGLLEELEREVGFKRAELWIKRISEAVLAEREACAEKTGEFARKWWSIHCETNKHMETTLKAHQDFCALQAAIRARKTT